MTQKMTPAQHALLVGRLEEAVAHAKYAIDALWIALANDPYIKFDSAIATEAMVESPKFSLYTEALEQIKLEGVDFDLSGAMAELSQTVIREAARASVWSGLFSNQQKRLELASAALLAKILGDFRNSIRE